MNQLIIRTRATPAGPVVELTGVLDHRTSPEVRALLPGLVLGAGQQLVIDLSGLTFCDSSGITVMIAARNHAVGTGGGIALAAVPDRVHRIFRIVGLDRVFTTYDTARDAEAAWQPPAP
ncbi:MULTISPECIES: STAS domain-containing protein [unclassified Streptomyces]|uniref:STAS domain-containing protein n=1 Tax=unclassified Streptomyces TaxID=2593676 RepID=UPI0024820185|nr:MULTISPECIES: STAS domain-containing protein [unclassified Streptomyces]MDA5284009.1 STAS domain-containing protein [Streptomyces sp. Isolate_45]MDX2389086.1 STAS domain-containing protein [Streptomyces sp. DK15]